MKIRWICIGLAFVACGGDGGAQSQPSLDVELGDASGDGSNDDRGGTWADGVMPSTWWIRLTSAT
jgi:hypothetical protein